MNIGENIRKIRKEKKMSSKYIADYIGCSQQAILQYERGERNPSIDILNKIALALDVPTFMLTENISSELLNIFIKDMHYLEKNSALNTAMKLTSKHNIKSEKYEKIEILEELLHGFKQLENSFNKFKQDYIVGLEEYLITCKEDE